MGELLSVLAITAGATVLSLLAYRLLVWPWRLPRWLMGMGPGARLQNPAR